MNFTLVFTKDNGTNPVFGQRFDGNSVLSDVIFRTLSVKNVLSHVNIQSAAGPDGLPGSFWNKLSSSLSVPVSKIFQKSFNTSEIPSGKLQSLFRFLKKGNSANPGNYRPVSLTCIAAKAMEAIISLAMVSHLVKNNHYSDEKHSFLKQKNTET